MNVSKKLYFTVSILLFLSSNILFAQHDVADWHFFLNGNEITSEVQLAPSDSSSLFSVELKPTTFLTDKYSGDKVYGKVSRITVNVVYGSYAIHSETSYRSTPVLLNSLHLIDEWKAKKENKKKNGQPRLVIEIKGVLIREKADGKKFEVPQSTVYSLNYGL